MNSTVSSFLRSKWTVPVACSVVSFGVGAVAGYLFAKRQEKEIIDVLIEDTVQLTFTFEEEVETPKFVIDESVWTPAAEYTLVWTPVAEYTTVTQDDEGHITVIEEGGEESMINVFASTDEDWDYELEAFNRDPEKPYIIHRDEFFADEMGWDSQSTVTWYVGDCVLVDSRDEPVMNPERIVGDLKFGHGSGDPSVCYVRNERLQAEYEVLRDPGSYEMDVLGGHVESQMEREDFRHSRSPGKFRGD